MENAVFWILGFVLKTHFVPKNALFSTKMSQNKFIFKASRKTAHDKVCFLFLGEKHCGNIKKSYSPKSLNCYQYFSIWKMVGVKKVWCMASPTLLPLHRLICMWVKQHPPYHNKWDNIFMDNVQIWCSLTCWIYFWLCDVRLCGWGYIFWFGYWYT